MNVVRKILDANASAGCTMGELARRLSLPRRLVSEVIRKYGMGGRR
jgi:hypothetical protein